MSYLSLIGFFMASGFAAEIEVHGHRGTRGLLPENTLPAFKSALEAGADVLEMDLAVTLDGVLVISHDPHINSQICLNPDGSKIQNPPLIHSLPLSEVKRFDCGTLINPRFKKQTPIPGTTIPTLEEVFDLVRDSKHANAKTIRFNIETKIDPTHPDDTIGPEEFSQKVVAAFKKSGFWDRILLQSFDPRTLIEARKLEPTIQISILIESPKTNMLELAKQIQADVVSPYFGLLSSKKVTELKNAGFKVVPWTVNEKKSWDSLITMGVDGIITDYPAALLAYLKR